MRTVPLHGKKAAGRVALVDDGDYDLVMQYRWYCWECTQPNGSRSGPYARTNVRHGGKFRVIGMHNLVTGYAGVDHVNHDGLDNQRSNLRPATQSQNMGNSRKTATETSSVYKGVQWLARCQKWLATIKFQGKSQYLGLYTSEATAARAYDAKAAELFGEYACLNFPGEPPAAPPREPKYANAPYRQVAAILRDKITSGALSGRLPAEKKMAVQYGVAMMTMRKVLAILRDEGLITTYPGSGSEVAPRP